MSEMNPLLSAGSGMLLRACVSGRCRCCWGDLLESPPSLFPAGPRYAVTLLRVTDSGGDSGGCEGAICLWLGPGLLPSCRDTDSRGRPVLQPSACETEGWSPLARCQASAQPHGHRRGAHGFRGGVVKFTAAECGTVESPETGTLQRPRQRAGSTGLRRELGEERRAAEHRSAQQHKQLCWCPAA